jgi:hypothetical protein
MVCGRFDERITPFFRARSSHSQRILKRSIPGRSESASIGMFRSESRGAIVTIRIKRATSGSSEKWSTRASTTPNRHSKEGGSSSGSGRT